MAVAGRRAGCNIYAPFSAESFLEGTIVSGVWRCSATCTRTRMVVQFGGGPWCRMIYPQQRTERAASGSLSLSSFVSFVVLFLSSSSPIVTSFPSRWRLARGRDSLRVPRARENQCRGLQPGDNSDFVPPRSRWQFQCRGPV